MQEAAIGVEHGHLLLPGGHHPRVAVAHVGHVVDAVQQLVAALVVHVLSLGPHDLERVLAVEKLARPPHVLVAQLHRLIQRQLLQAALLGLGDLAVAGALLVATLLPHGL